MSCFHLDPSTALPSGPLNSSDQASFQPEGELGVLLPPLGIRRKRWFAPPCASHCWIFAPSAVLQASTSTTLQLWRARIMYSPLPMFSSRNCWLAPPPYSQ